MLNIDFWKDKKILVTGGTGFIGSWLCMTLIELGADVYVLSKSGGIDGGLFNVCKLKQKVTLYEGDIRDKSFVYSSITGCCPEIIFHLAAQPIYSVAKEQPFYTYETNISGTLNVIESAKQIGVFKIIFITSEHWDGKQVENISIYAASKACSEIVIRSLMDLFDNEKPNMSIIRMINTAGGGDRELSRIIPYCIECLNYDRPIILNRPNNTMRFVYVMDAVMVLLQIAREHHGIRTWNVSELIGEIENMTVARIRDLIVESYQSPEIMADICDRVFDIYSYGINGQRLRIVYTQPADAIFDSVYIEKNIFRRQNSSIIYGICQSIISRYINASGI